MVPGPLVGESPPMLDAIDRWENEGGAVCLSQGPQPVPEPAGATAATAVEPDAPTRPGSPCASERGCLDG